MRTLKKYYVDEYDSVVYAISMVDEPAIESNFMTFSSDRKPIAFESDEKRIVCGPVLVPDLPIYRRDESGFEYYIEFGAKAIEHLSRNFFRTGQDFTLDHERFAPGVFLAESWLKSDLERDKSVALGLDPNLPKGTWFVSAYVDSDEVWQQVKSGKWSGWSVESLISMVEETFKKEKINEEEMNESNKKETFLEKVKNIFEEVFGSQDCEAEVELEATPEVEEPAPEEAPEVEESEAKDEPVEVAEPEEVAEAEEEAKPEEEAIEHLSSIATLEDENAQLKNQVEQLLAKVTELTEANEKLAKQPSAKPVEVKAAKQDSASDKMNIIRQLHEGTYFKN